MVFQKKINKLEIMVSIAIGRNKNLIFFKIKVFYIKLSYNDHLSTLLNFLYLFSRHMHVNGIAFASEVFNIYTIHYVMLKSSYFLSIFQNFLSICGKIIPLSHLSTLSNLASLHFCFTLCILSAFLTRNLIQIISTLV